MESGNGGAWSEGVLVPVAAGSDVFQNNVLAPLKSAYLYEESKQSFRYKSAVLIKNPALEEKYNAFRAQRREAGYSEEDLKESYGFLLFDDLSQANALGETGVLTGNSTCTTLGDPSKGVYISVYSDCLDLNRWYHGKSGYIAIIRLTKGRVNKVLENYTQNFTAPTEGFDCHVSEQLPSVSAKTSSFLAFERTQYYVYELLDDGGKETAQSPSAACPFAIVSFSYTDTKATLVVPQEESEEKKTDCNYFPWRGQFQIGTHIYDFGLRSTEGATIPAELPAVVKVDRAISMLELRQLLPRAVFETSFSGEVFLDGLYCSLCELVSSEAEQSISFSLLLREIKEKDVALIILLNDGGFLILLHSSHFFTYDDSGSSESEVLQGMFVFPDSRVIQRETKFGQRKHAMSSEILRVLPVLSYAEGEVEKTPIEPREDLCEVFAQHMQSYAALINPGLALSPSRDFNIFPDQYDVPDAHKHLYVSPEWTNRSWQNFRSYLNKPVSFQLPVSKASEILATGQEELIADLDDDVYFCPSSPEEPLSNHVGMTSEAQLTEQRTAVNVESFVDSCIKNVEGQVDLTAVPQVVAPDDLQPGGATKDSEKSDLTVLIKTDGMGTKNLLTPSKSDDLPAELIVSITSAEQTVTNASLSVISTESTIKHNDFQLSGFSTAKFETVGVNSLNDEIVKTKKVLDCPELTNLPKRKCRKPHGGFTRGRKHVSKACIDTPSLETVETPVKDENLKSQKEDQAKKLSSKPQLNNSSNSDWRKMRRQKLKFGSLENKKLRSATVDLAVAEQKTWTAGQQFFKSTILMELEAGPLRKKTERWDLKPVISECGRILVPHGSVDIADQIKTLKDKLQSTKDEPCPEKMSDDASVNTHDTFQIEQESSTAPETAVDKTEATTSQTGGNHSQNVIVSHVNPKHNILRQSDDRNGSLALNPERSEHSLKDDGTDTPPLKTVQEKHNDTASPGKCATKGEFLLKKLRSVLRRKRKTGILVSEETTADTAQDTEPCLKKGKVDLDSVMLKSNDEMTIVQDTNLGVKEVSKMLSVDPLFAYALGLTPKETPDKIQKSDRQDTEQRKDSSEPQDQTILDKQPQIIQRPLSIFPRRGRIKTLKKHQGISAEHVKKKWWLHFQTPACFASEKLKYKERTRDNSVRKTVKDKNNSACSSTDALNLLADLALSANNDQVPLKPDPAKRKPETSLKKCDHTKDVTSGEQESVLHALLRQPAARPILPLESPSPSHLVGGSELVGLISKEHAYSLPPSSSLLLDLSGTSFQVSPLSGSTRLLHHHQTMCGDGIKTLHPSVDQEDISEQNHRTPEYLKKHMVCRRKFRNSRTFVTKDGSVQVTKQWKENYDFNLDSKFMSDSKDKAIIRALHGPWDFSIQDTSEEVRLIVHMWIGLFYSRSTARFFHFDSNLTNQSSENCDSLDISSGMLSAPAQSEHKDNSFAPNPTVPNTSDTLISKALDLSKKDNSVLDQGSVILDLSLRNSNTETVTSDQQVDKEETPVSGEQTGASETLNTLKSSMGLQKTSTLQCYRNSIHSTEIISEVTDVRRHYEGERTCTPCQEVGCMEHADEPSSEDGGTFISVEGDTERVSCQLENQQTASGAGHVLHGCYNEKTDVKDDIDDSEATKMSLVQKQERHLSKSVIDKEADSSKKADDVDSTFVHEEIESKDGGNWEIKERPYQEGNEEVSPKVIHAGDDSANEKSDVVCNGNLLKSEKQLSSEEPKAVSPGEAGNVNEDAECCAAHEEKVIKDDHFRKDVLDEKDNCTSNVEADSDLIDQPLPKLCDGPESVKTDCIPEWNGQARLNEQLPQAHYEEDACPDMQLKKLCANSSALTDESAISVEASHALSGIEPVCNEPIIEKNSENSICLVNKAHNQKAALPFSDERTCLLDGSSADGSVPQTSDSVETGSQNKVMTNFNPRGDDHEDWDTKLVKEEQNADNTAQEELLYHQSHSPQCMAVTKFKSEGTLNKETDLKNDNRNEGLEKICCQVVIPFIGVDTSGDDASQSEGKVEVQEQIETSFVSENTCSETVLPTEVGSTSQMYSKDAELSTGKISLSLLDIRKNNQLEVSGSESDDRCPTPTIDEEPYQYVTISGPSGSGSSAFSSSEAFKNMNPKYVSKSSTFLKDKMLLVKKHKSKVNCDSTPPHGLHPDLEQRTLRVLQSIDKFLSSSSHTDKSSQIKTVDIKPSLDQQDKLLEISLGQDCHPHRSFPSTECLQAIKPNPDQDRQKTTSQTNLSHEPRSHSQRPVMAVKPSKSDEIQADCMSKDREIENSVISCFSKNQKTKTLVHTFSTPASMLLENNARLKGNFTGLNDDKQEASQNSSESAWLSNVSDVKSHSDQAKFAVLDPLYHYKRSDTSEFTKIPLSSLPTSSKHVGGSQNFLTKCSVEKIGQTTKETIGINQNDCSDASTSVGDSKDDGIIDDSLFLDPQSSLTCTVYNTSQKRSSSFLEQLSQRCLQDNLTQASVEQECLIFSEQMKQLLKRSKRGPIHQLDEQDNLNLSCSGPVTVHFSSLEEREDSVDHMNVPSLVGLKIKVDMSDRKDLADTTEKDNTYHPQKLSQGTENPVEHTGVFGVTAECARLYSAMMNDVCAVKKVPSRPKQFRMDRGYPKTEPSNHFDFYDQMKREMDESFRSHLNSVVKKCCKTKYRFYILVTSDDSFFEETKVQLEAEGHTTLQPSEFFCGEDSSSSLLIILRNEDIAEYICKIPHLLKLKKSPDVQFAGIDEPDDVVNLTHQELFIRGGFIMFDRASLESLSLCNMKKMSDILLELSRTGKWKWMLHYRDSRRLKENARLNAEAKEKKHFLNWCQDVGILEVLPYHECDLMSRDQPDYLTCLVRLQVQNISARYPVFITDTTTDSAFGTNGILTMTLKSFLTCSPSKTFMT